MESGPEPRKIIYEKKMMAFKDETREAFLQQFDDSLRERGGVMLGANTFVNLLEIFKMISTQGNVYLFLLIYPYCSLLFLMFPYNFYF